MTIDEYHEKRRNEQLNEARELVIKYRERFKKPDDVALHAFFWLFTNAASELTPKRKCMMKLMGNEKQSYYALKGNIKEYQSMNDCLISIQPLDEDAY